MAEHTILTARQRIEAAVYDQRMREQSDRLTDDDLRVDASRPPFPNREHVDFLSFAIGRLGDVRGADLLEVGCGTGALSVYMALNGANVLGIDVSEENVAVATRRALANGVADRCAFRVVPIEQLLAPDSSFDAIIGNQVLHHFELPEAMPNIRRLLKRGGRALFCEPVLLLPSVLRRMRDGAAIKRILPKKVDTPTERSVSIEDLAVIKRTFPGVQVHPFQMLARLQNFVELDDRWFARLEQVDRLLLRLIPPLRMVARFVVFEVRSGAALEVIR